MSAAASIAPQLNPEFDPKALKKVLDNLGSALKSIDKMILEIKRWKEVTGVKEEAPKDETSVDGAATEATTAAANAGGRSVSGQDLKTLEDNILNGETKKGKAPAWLEKAIAVHYNPWNFDKEMNARSKSLEVAFAKGGFRAVFAQSTKLGRIKGGTGIGALVSNAVSEKVDKYIENNKKHKIVNIYGNIREEKKKKKGSSTFGTAVRLFIHFIQHAIGDRVSSVVSTVTHSINTRFAATKAGRKLINFTTSAKTLAGEKLGPIKTIATTTGKVFTGVFDAVNFTGSVLSGFGSAVMPAIMLSLATGGSIPAGIAAFGVIGSSAAINNVLGKTSLNSIGFIKNFQTKFGVGQYYNFDGSLKMGAFAQDEALLARKNIFTPFARVNNVIHSGATAGAWGSFAGMVLGPLIGLDPGTGSMVGGLVGTGIGAGSRAVWDKVYGKAAAESAMGIRGGLIGKLGYVPFMEVLGQVQGNLWIASQMDLIINKYHGDIGRYFKENFISGDPGKMKLENILLIGGNWLSLGFAVPAALFPSVTIGAMLRMIVPSALLGKIALTPLTIASVAGEAAGIAALVLLGVPIGPGAIIGLTIGSLVGTGLGIVVSLVAGLFSEGVGWLASAAITGLFSAVGTAVGGWIGSLFDSAVGKFAGYINVTINGISALANLLAMIQAKIDVGSLISVVIALIGLFTAMDKMGNMTAANQCLETKNCPNPNASPGYGQGSPHLQELSFYGVTMIQSSIQGLPDDQRTILMEYLNKSTDIIHAKYGSKKIFLNTVNATGFEGDNFVIIGLNVDDFNSLESLTAAFDKQLTNISNSSQILSSPENLMQALN